jgi:hypothetical protein
VAGAAERAREVTSGEIARQLHARAWRGSSRRDDFIADHVETDDAGVVAIRKTAPDGVADGLTQLREIIGLGDDRRADAAADVAAFRRFFDQRTNRGVIFRPLIR